MKYSSLIEVNIMSRGIFKQIILLVLLLPITYSKDCKKIDLCKCTFDDGSGTVDLSALGSRTGTPLISDIFAADNYAYSFDPCYPFTEGTCIDAMACQYDLSNAVYYQLGDPDTVKYSNDGTNVIATSSHSTGSANRTTKATYICDQNAATPSFVVSGEVSTTHYEFIITSKEACPSMAPDKHTCSKVDQCRCTFNDGLGIVDLAGIGRQDGTPLFKDVPGMDGSLYSFNPCYPFTEDVCKDVAACQFETNSSLYYPVGDESDNEFYYDGHNVIVRYSSKSQTVTRTSIVTFICDPAATTPTISAIGEVADAEYLFTVTSSAICPKPVPTCDKVDNCKCKMSDGSGTVDLSLVGNQGGTPLIDNVAGPDPRYRYFFNPCYLLTEGTCVNKSACLVDTKEGRYYDIGGPDVTFTFDGAKVTASYMSSNHVMGSKVDYVCTTGNANTTVKVDGEISPALYGFRVSSKDLCPGITLPASG